MKKLLVIIAIAALPVFAATKVQDKTDYCSVPLCTAFGWFCC